MIHEPLPSPQALDGVEERTTREDRRPPPVERVVPAEPVHPHGVLRHPDAPAATPHHLRNRLVRIDATITALAWAVVLVGAGLEPLSFVVAVGVAVAATLAAVAVQQLYRARVCAVRRVARRGFAISALAAPAALVLTDPVVLADDIWAERLAVGAVLTFVGLCVAREAFEQWLRASRVRGHHVRPVIVGGTATEVEQVVRLLEAHPEVGCRAVAWVGPHPGAGVVPALATVPWVGDATELVDATALVGANGVVIGPTVAAEQGFGELARELQARRIHVQVSSGLWGIDPCRLRTLPMAHEPFFYLEPLRQGSGRRRVKRVVDVVIASAVLVLTAPILVVAAVLVKLHDGGPVLFRQVRVGLGGEPFELHKFRTMTVDAESRLAALAEQNERSGPLFKIDADPRVTPVGRVLRATSVDELPQMLDVIAGRLSLVGPRPALPDEVASFDDALLGRHQVLPGVTGLWQVEARHNPSFDAYRHLDLFYVENWTLGLDLAILAATVKTVVTDAAGALAAHARTRALASQEVV